MWQHFMIYILAHGTIILCCTSGIVLVSKIVRKRPGFFMNQPLVAFALSAWLFMKAWTHIGQVVQLFYPQMHLTFLIVLVINAIAALMAIYALWTVVDDFLKQPDSKQVLATNKEMARTIADLTENTPHHDV